MWINLHWLVCNSQGLSSFVWVFHIHFRLQAHNKTISAVDSVKCILVLQKNTDVQQTLGTKHLEILSAPDPSWPSFSITCVIVCFMQLSNCHSARVPSLQNRKWNRKQTRRAMKCSPNGKKRRRMGEHKRQTDKEVMKQWATTSLLNEWALKVHLRISLWSRKACLLTRDSGPLGHRVNYQFTKIYACGRFRAEAQIVQCASIF